MFKILVHASVAGSNIRLICIKVDKTNPNRCINSSSNRYLLLPTHGTNQYRIVLYICIYVCIYCTSPCLEWYKPKILVDSDCYLKPWFVLIPWIKKLIDHGFKYQFVAHDTVSMYWSKHRQNKSMSSGQESLKLHKYGRESLKLRKRGWESLKLRKHGWESLKLWKHRWESLKLRRWTKLCYWGSPSSRSRQVEARHKMLAASGSDKLSCPSLWVAFVTTLDSVACHEKLPLLAMSSFRWSSQATKVASILSNTDR